MNKFCQNRVYYLRLFYVVFFSAKRNFSELTATVASSETVVISSYHHTVELQRLEHLWNHMNMFETGVVRANECQVRWHKRDIFFRFSLT